jgi:hypothetical protein
MVIGAHDDGVPSRYLLIAASRAIRFSCTSSMIPVAMNCLLTEPILYTVSRVAGVLRSLSASP